MELQGFEVKIGVLGALLHGKMGMAIPWGCAGFAFRGTNRASPVDCLGADFVRRGSVHFKKFGAKGRLLQRDWDDSEPPGDLPAAFEGEPLVWGAAGRDAFHQ